MPASTRPRPPAAAREGRRGAGAPAGRGGRGGRGRGNAGRGNAGRGNRKEQILGCAARLFATRGFHGVSVDDLGAAAGVTGPALYRHFRAKEDILAELLVGVSQRLLEGGRQRVDSAADAAAALAALVEFHVEFALDEPDVITVQERDLANLPPDASRAVRALQHDYVSVWADVVEQLTACNRAQGVAAAHAAFGLVNSTPHSARLPRAQMAALLGEMATAALRAAGNGQSRARGGPPTSAP
ncbi:MAG TPA: TetR/AcrR family transcriptional regulator [Acidimicrobiales bacterium]|nr:TetR/AcrR family transcriptional regulator [Acidimicrobiales bacterium]